MNCKCACISFSVSMSRFPCSSTTCSLSQCIQNLSLFKFCTQPVPFPFAFKTRHFPCSSSTCYFSMFIQNLVLSIFRPQPVTLHFLSSKHNFSMFVQTLPQFHVHSRPVICHIVHSKIKISQFFTFINILSFVKVCPHPVICQSLSTSCPLSRFVHILSFVKVCPHTVICQSKYRLSPNSLPNILIIIDFLHKYLLTPISRPAFENSSNFRKFISALALR